MADARRTPVDFLGPPSRLRLASGDAEAIVNARAVHWPEGQQHKRAAALPVLRRGRDASRTRLRLDPLTPPGKYTVVLELADGARRDATVSVQPRRRLLVTPSELRFEGPPGGAVMAQLLLENRGNVAIPIGEALVTGVFDDDGIETALASTYRMETDDLNKIVGNIFARLREAHGGLLRLRVAEGAGELAPGDRRVLKLETTLNSKLRRGHAYHGVLDIGEHGIAVSLRIEGTEAPNDKQGGA
jgi:hypothetical protein